MTAEEARLGFLRWLADERRASPLTVEAYGQDLAALLGFLTGHLGAEPDLAALANLRAADFRAWLASQAAAGLQSPTRARHLSAARTFFRYLRRRHGVANPALSLLATPRTKPPAPRTLPPAQAMAIAREIGEASDKPAIQARDTALFTLLYGCGLRIAEALALNVRNAPLPAPMHRFACSARDRKSALSPYFRLCAGPSRNG